MLSAKYGIIFYLWSLILLHLMFFCNWQSIISSCFARRKFRHLGAGNAVEIAHYVRRERTPPLYAWPKGVLRGPRGRWFPSRSIMLEPYRHNYTDGVSVTSQTICRRVEAGRVTCTCKEPYFIRRLPCVYAPWNGEGHPEFSIVLR